MNPIKAIKLAIIYEKFQSILKEKKPMNLKIAPLLTLFGTGSTTVGLPLVAHDFVTVHPMLYLCLVAFSIALHAIMPSIFGAPSDADKKASGLGSVTSAILFVLAFGLLAAAPMRAQSVADYSNIYAGGLSYSFSGSPAIAGTGLYARSLNDSGTYAFTVADILPSNADPLPKPNGARVIVPSLSKPVVITTNIGAGVAQKVFSIGKLPIFIPTSAGVSVNGQNLGWSWTGGALTAIPFKKFYIMPNVRFLKSSVAGPATSYQPIVSVFFGGAF